MRTTPDNSAKENKRKLSEVFSRRYIAFRIVAGIVLLLLLFTTMAIAIGYWQFSDNFTDEYADSAYRIAEAASSYVDAAALDRYLENGGASYEYQHTYRQLDTLCNKVNARFIYVIRPDLTDYEHITFVFNIVNADSGFDPYPAGYERDTTNDEYKEKYRRLMEGVSDREYVVRDEGYIETGSHITAMIPMKLSNGKVTAILCVQRQMDALGVTRIRYTQRVFYAMLIFLMIASVIYSLFLNRSIIRPLRIITKETERFSTEPSPAESPLSEQIVSRTEIGTLATSIDRMEQETLDYIENLTAVTAERHRIGAELELASKIQAGVLNNIFPDEREFDLFASMHPAKEVGGDFYDFFRIDDDHLGLVMADVSGKGVPAALFMMISKIMLNYSAMDGSSPAEILHTVNERICQNNQLDMFVTVWLGILELSTGRLIAANAGHEYPAVYRSGERFELYKDKHGFVIGGMSGVRYRDYELTLNPGDALFLYTDGLPEATDANEVLFGTDRMLGTLNREPDATPFALLSRMQTAVDEFVGDAPQFDDLTMLCLKFRGPKTDPDASASAE
jgi:sigma-B regulation protein RsbU (phosphoserine phosphatase)